MSSPDVDNGVIRYTTKELLASIDKKIDHLFDKLDDKADLTVQQDHEERIRRLEKFRYSMPSIALISLVLTIATLAYFFITGNNVNTP